MTISETTRQRQRQVTSVSDSGIAVFNSLERFRLFDDTVSLDKTLMVVTINGGIEATVDLTHRRMGPGQVMVLRGAHVIKGIVQSPDFEGFFIIVENNRIDDMLPMYPYMASCILYFKDRPIITAEPDEIESLKIIYSLFTRSTGSRLPYHRMMVNSLCEVLFYETLGLYTSRMNRTNKQPSRREELLSKFISLVEKNFMKERTVLFYAKKMCLSPKHLSTVIKEVSGRPAGDWIDSQVILKAKMLLRNTGMSVQEISDTLNFTNQSFFGKYFKQKTGMSPRTFRSNPDAEPQ